MADKFIGSTQRGRMLKTDGGDADGPLVGLGHAFGRAVGHAVGHGGHQTRVEDAVTNRDSLRAFEPEEVEKGLAFPSLRHCRQPLPSP